MKKLSTINLHLTDVCNYHCKFCFVRKESKELKLDQIKFLVDKAKRYFDYYNLDGRINLVGGEPLCYGHIQDVIDYIYSLNIKVSIVTNGFLLTEDFINYNKDKLYMIGISVDSLNANTNQEIGRCCYKMSISKERLIDICECIKKNGIKLKINTCVMKTNFNEDIRDFIELVNPDRFKIFQEVPETKFGKENAISNDEFKDYLKKYDGIKFKSETVGYMLENYLIIDSRGYLSTNNRHTEGVDILNNKEIKDCFDY